MKTDACEVNAAPGSQLYGLYVAAIAIVLEGLAFAFIIYLPIAYLPIAALLVNLRTAGAWMPHLDPADLLLSPGLLVAIGVLLAWRRVQ